MEIVFLFCLECSSPLFGHMFAFLLPPRKTFSQTSCRLSFRYRGWHLKTSDSTQNIDKILRCHIFDSSWQIPSQKRYRQSFPEEHCLLPSLFFTKTQKIQTGMEMQKKIHMILTKCMSLKNKSVASMIRRSPLESFLN